MTLQAGPELDRLVAEKVMGWTADVSDPAFIAYTDGCRHWIGWSPSTDISHAWEVVENIHRRGWHIEVHMNCPSGVPMCYICFPWTDPLTRKLRDDGRALATRATVTLAICLAALQAVTEVAP